MPIDLVALAATVVGSYLVPYVTMGAQKMGEELAGTVGASVASHLTEASKKIWERVKAAFSSDREAQALTQLREFPEEGGPEFVQTILLRKLEKDPQLARDLHELVEAASPDGGATSGAQVMQSSGIVNLLDARGADFSHSQHARVAGAIYGDHIPQLPRNADPDTPDG
jgi:wyosine [tRNA(Phe)-imidazoG37] synthetase (radical SAM superfamily)